MVFRTERCWSQSSSTSWFYRWKKHGSERSVICSKSHMLLMVESNLLTDSPKLPHLLCAYKWELGPNETALRQMVLSLGILSHWSYFVSIAWLDLTLARVLSWFLLCLSSYLPQIPLRRLPCTMHCYREKDFNTSCIIYRFELNVP